MQPNDPEPKMALWEGTAKIPRRIVGYMEVIPKPRSRKYSKQTDSRNRPVKYYFTISGNATQELGTFRKRLLSEKVG
jgi:hypothetical protein